MNEKEEGEKDVLAPGTLVKIKGLQSDAGKPLNGGLGIVFGPPSKAESEEARRYPILLYAIVETSENEIDKQSDVSGAEAAATELKCISPLLQKSIKAVNLDELPDQKCELYWQQAMKHCHETIQVNQDYKAGVFWLSGYYQRWPEDIHMSITYANILRHTCNEPKEAWKILRETVPRLEPDDARINESCYDACVACCLAEGKPEVALDWALKIQTDTEDHKQLAIEAIEAVIRYSRGNYKRFVDLDSGDGPLLEVHLRAAEARLAIQPENGGYMGHVAGAHCLLGNNKEGVRMYRRALASGQFEGEALEELKSNLGLAMMQCPGGAMEHYRVMGVMGDRYECIHKASIGQYEFFSSGSGDGSFTGGICNTGASEGLDIMYFPIPDIDDPDLFQDVDLPPLEE